MKKGLLLFSALTLLGLNGCAHFFGTSNALAPKPLPRITAHVKKLDTHTLWSGRVGGYVYGSHLSLRPTLSGAVLYTATPDGDVRATDLVKGKRLWKTNLKLDLAQGPTLIGSDLWLSSLKGDLISLNPKTHQIRWTQPLTSQLWAAPQGNENRAAILTQDSILKVIQTETGESLWEFHAIMPRLSLRGSGVLLDCGDFLYVGFPNGHLMKFEMATGRVLWDRALSEPMGANEMARLVDIKTVPIATGSEIFAANYQGHLLALEEGTAEAFWSQDVSTERNMVLDESANNLYLIDTEGRVMAFSAQTGVSVWEQDALMGRLTTSPLLWENRLLLVGDYQGFVHGLDLVTGQLVWRKRIGNNPIVEPILSSHAAIYALDEQGKMLAFKIESN